MNDRGQGLIIIVIVLVTIMLLIAVAMLALSYSEFSASFLDKDERYAYEAAKAGLEDARIRIARNGVAASDCGGAGCTLSKAAGTLQEGSVTYQIEDVTGSSLCDPAQPDRQIDSRGSYGSSKRRIEAVVYDNGNGEILIGCMREKGEYET